jgi:putative holliday junction resolvase
MRYLAIDYGTRRTGLAICDPSETIVSPLAVIEGQKNLAEKILEIIARENVEAIVLGLPLNMDGTAGSQAKMSTRFAEELKKRANIPVHFQDERLSSFAAEEKLAPADFTRKKKAKRLDAIAAAQILESFLEQKKSQ